MPRATRSARTRARCKNTSTRTARISPTKPTFPTSNPTLSRSPHSSTPSPSRPSSDRKSKPDTLIIATFPSSKTHSSLPASSATARSSPTKRSWISLTSECCIDIANSSFTISQNTYFTFRGRFSEVLVVEMKVEKAEYEKAIGWIKDLMTGLIFAKDR